MSAILLIKAIWYFGDIGSIFLYLIPDTLQLPADLRLQIVRPSEQTRKLARQPLHLRREGFRILRLRRDTHIAPRRQNKVLRRNLLRRRHGAEALLRLQTPLGIGPVGVGDALDVAPTGRILRLAVGQLAQLARNHCSEVARVDEERMARLRLGLVEEPDRDRNLRRIKELRRHGHDAVHQVGFDEPPPDVALAAALARERAVGQHDARTPRRGQMVDDVLNPREVGVAVRRGSVLPAHVVGELVGAPVAEVEGRIGQHEVGLERRVAVVEEGVGVVLPQVGLDAPDGEVHLRHLPRRGVRILAVDRDVVDVAGVALDEARRLHEHPARTAAGVVDTPPEGLQHLHEGFDHARRGVEFAGQLALGLGEARETVFVGAAEDVLRVAVLVHADVGEEVDDLAQTPFVELGPCEVFGQDVLQAPVFALDGPHGVVDGGADFGGVGLRGDGLPARLGGDVEDVLGGVFVLVLLEALALVDELAVFGLELVGNVFQEDQTQHDGLVFRRVDIAAHLVRRAPDLLLEADIGRIHGCHR